MITRVAIIFWVIPLALYSAWFILSANDINFGTIYLSRRMHDAIMQTYANLLGIDPAIIPALLIRAVIWDGAVIAAILVYRRRKAISAWWRARRSTAPAVAEEEASELPVTNSLTAAQGDDPVQRPL